MPPAEDDRFPDEDDLAAAVIGAGSRKRRTRVRPERPIAVSVVHGNLAFARHVIAVGHYAGDAIISAEKHLDLALEGALTRRHQMGLYPGPIETSAIFTNPRCSDARFLGLKGALVIGLGTVGSLSAAQLTRSFARALLEYALERSKQPHAPAAADACQLGVSALLIGTGAGGMSVPDSVYALIRGAVRANQTLAATKQAERISTLEFVELWEDRTVQALEALHMLSEQAGIREAIDLAPTVDGRDGGLRRLSYDEPSGWWQRLQILGGRRDGELADGGLRFAALTGRARTEVRLLSTQQQLVDQYIEGAIASTRDNRAVARTMFDLLLPNELKESAPDQDNVVLLLDEDSARYPWELLEDGSREGRKPWVIEHGLLRQLESQEFRSTIQAVAENTALVIGDPVSSFVELKGAQAEAEAVWQALQGTFLAAKHIRPTTQEVVSALFARPYKLLHLAGHGVYRYVPQGARNCDACGQALSDTLLRQQTVTPVTGMVIGDGVFLTPAEVQQMRRVPDLVFINCCYLGLVEAPRPGTPPIGQQRAFPRLAANIATEFIRMGVRAVVAAGWAVDDAAAATFSTIFYDEMLKGHAFGEAVKLARSATFERHPGSNTWGAYQCYGDPEYRLVLSAARNGGTTDSIRIVSPAHAVQDLSNIAARLKTRATASAAGELERIEQIAKLVEQKGWLHNGLVTSALARAYGEAGKLDIAIPLFRQALSAEDAAASMRDVEQLANFEVRHAMSRWQQGAALTGRERDALHRSCVSQIEDAHQDPGNADGAAARCQAGAVWANLRAAGADRICVQTVGADAVREEATPVAGADGDLLSQSCGARIGATGRHRLSSAECRGGVSGAPLARPRRRPGLGARDLQRRDRPRPVGCAHGPRAAAGAGAGVPAVRHVRRCRSARGACKRQVERRRGDADRHEVSRLPGRRQRPRGGFGLHPIRFPARDGTRPGRPCPARESARSDTSRRPGRPEPIANVEPGGSHGDIQGRG